VGGRSNEVLSERRFIHKFIASLIIDSEAVKTIVPQADTVSLPHQFSIVACEPDSLSKVTNLMASPIRPPHYRPLFIPATGEILVGEVLQTLNSACCSYFLEEYYDWDGLFEEIESKHDVRVSPEAVQTFLELGLVSSYWWRPEDDSRVEWTQLVAVMEERRPGGSGGSSHVTYPCRCLC
jgi:hypothetical protein